MISTLPEQVGVEIASTDLHFGGKIRSPYPLVRGFHVFPDGSKVPLDRHRIYPDGRKVAVNQPWTPIQSMISDFLGRFPEGACIFEDHLHSASDALPRHLGHLASFGDEIYASVSADWAGSIDPISSFIRQHFGSWLEVGVLTSLPVGSLPPYGEAFTSDQLEGIADRAEAVIIEAYDSEGHVVWTRTNGERWLRF